MVYLLGYFSLTQETSGNRSRPFFKRGRCRIDAILDFKDKPTFPRRCWSLSGKAAGSPLERKPLLSKLVSIHPFKEISLGIKSLKVMSKEMEVSLLFTAFQEWLQEQAQLPNRTSVFFLWVLAFIKHIMLSGLFHDMYNLIFKGVNTSNAVNLSD